MKGHEDIISLRRARQAPAMVFINDYPCKTDWLRERAAATVCTHGDVIQMLDLRFLVGLKVSISSDSEVRAKALMEACRNAGAHTVAACHVQEGRQPWQQSGWCEVWSKQPKESPIESHH